MSACHRRSLTRPPTQLWRMSERLVGWPPLHRRWVSACRTCCIRCGMRPDCRTCAHPSSEHRVLVSLLAMHMPTARRRYTRHTYVHISQRQPAVGAGAPPAGRAITTAGGTAPAVSGLPITSGTSLHPHTQQQQQPMSPRHTTTTAQAAQATDNVQLAGTPGLREVDLVRGAVCRRSTHRVVMQSRPGHQRRRDSVHASQCPRAIRRLFRQQHQRMCRTLPHASAGVNSKSGDRPLKSRSRRDVTAFAGHRG